MAEATLRFLTDTAFQAETRRRAYQYAKPMFWPNVGRRYLDVFTQVCSTRETTAAPSLRKASVTTRSERQTARLVPAGR
ncbi:MAG TPA: hypothetical protein DD670_04530 [Planctomycetaceae bacterium]|nr:hypothetical protein [Planctomycetaceae bacterium]